MGGVGRSRGLLERDDELDEIDRALAAALAGEGSLAVLEGPAGIGKTALLGAAGERAREGGAVVVKARGAELEAGFPYGLVRQLFEPLLRAADQPRRDRLLGGAADAARVAVLGADGAPADPTERTFAVVHGLYWLVVNLAAEAPLALLVDDAHWADPPSLRFLVYLAARLAGLRVSLIVSFRTGDPGADVELASALRASAGASVAAPAPLSEAGVSEILATEFGVPPDPEFARVCRAVTGGNPFYVRELAAALRMDQIEPSFEAAAQIAAVAPPTIARVTLARLGRLSADAVALAQAIAVLGRDARLSRAAALAEIEQEAAAEALDVLVAAELLPGGSTLEYRHPIVRAAIYDEMAPGARSRAHQRAAELLAAEGAELDTVAAHLLGSQPAGDPATVARLRHAAAGALALGAPDAAATYLARALEEGPESDARATLVLELAQAEQLAAQPASVERFQEARRLATDSGTRAAASFSLAISAFFGGDWELMLESVDAALRDLADSDGPLRMRVEATRAAISMYDPRLVSAFHERLPILEWLVEEGVPGTRSIAFVLAAYRAQRDLAPTSIRPLVERAWGAGRYLEEGEQVELVPQAVGAAVMIEDLPLAEAIVAGFLRDARASASVIRYLNASAHEAWLQTRRGDLVAAAAELPSWVATAGELGVHTATLTILWYCSDVLLERPELSELAAMAQSIELGALGETATGALVLETRARLRHQAGDAKAALADMRRAARIHDDLGVVNSPGCTPWRSTLALMLAPSEREEARALIEVELAQARASHQRRRIGVALRALGLLGGGHDGGLSLLEAATAILAESPARLEHARALVELGAAHRRRGERVAARSPLREGLDLAARCGALRLAERARTELAATGARPRRAHLTGRDALTPSELRVARLAAEGRTNQEIAQALFVTPRTIDAHLNHAYTKLRISSRKQLTVALGPEP